MSRYELRFRQVHLDFHTSPHIPGIGEAFDRKQWQEALKLGRVNSITCFSKCHHGWSYHPTQVGRMHPHLKFDLLRAQLEASKEIGVNVPVYISAGLDDVMAAEHPEWREVGIGGSYVGWTTADNRPGFKTMCFNSPYLDYLCAQIEEVVRMFPECDGIFLDIISQSECCCRWCLRYMEENGLDAGRPEDRQACARAALLRYYERATAAARSVRGDLPLFHNSGHISRGRRDILPFFSHLELESLPTGGWGYDHFPLSARYCQNLPLDFLGMTGRFHTTWGEFGGYKHPDALRYECAQALANGAKVSIGDQLHPSGEMDLTTYRIIGDAYAEVESKEPFCRGATPVADIAVLSSEAEGHGGGPDTGAGRVLLEEHLLFTLVDRQTDFSPFRMLILPDAITVDEELREKLGRYLESGGKLLLTGRSGLRPDLSGFALDVGATDEGESPHQPDYLEAHEALRPGFVQSPLVMYLRSRQVRPDRGEGLGWIRAPYFNRTWRHYCSHQHAPAAARTGFPAAVRHGNILYLAHPVFSIYHALGAVAYRQYAANAIRLLLGDGQTLRTNLPSGARVTLMRQEEEARWVLHLLYAPRNLRGAQARLSAEEFVRDSHPVEVIEELIPLRDVRVELRLPAPVSAVSLEPQGEPLPFDAAGGTVQFTVPEFTCHQMVCLKG